MLFILPAGGCTAALERYEFREPKMGTTFRIVLYAADAQEADAAAKAAYARIDELNAILSDYDAQSELSRLSALSRGPVPTEWVRISDDLWRVLRAAQHWSRQSDGAFDVTVGPYVSLWRRQRRLGVLPSEARLAEAGRAVGWRKLELDEATQSVRLLASDMRLDLGGIAKGYTVDEVLKLLQQRGMDRALVDGGGDVAVGKAPPGLSGWRIALKPIDEPDAPIRHLTLTHAAVATSGASSNFVEIDTMRYSHIIDPATGLGLTHHLGVTIVARDCMTADALASAVSVMGAERGMALIEQSSEAAAWLVWRDEAGQLHSLCSQTFEALPMRCDDSKDALQ